MYYNYRHGCTNCHRAIQPNLSRKYEALPIRAINYQRRAFEQDRGSGHALENHQTFGVGGTVSATSGRITDPRISLHSLIFDITSGAKFRLELCGISPSFYQFYYVFALYFRKPFGGDGFCFIGFT